MGTAGDAYDNAMCESFFGTLEAELLCREHFATHEQARRRLFSFLESWYNIRGLHSSIGYCSPLEFENRPAVDNPRFNLVGRCHTALNSTANLSV
nr:integrase core domain-containing protein [Paraburkholderia aromaticivorans]